MKVSLFQVFATRLVMCAGNYSYQFMRSDPANYATAFERSWFQIVAVLMCWTLWRGWK